MGCLNRNKEQISCVTSWLLPTPRVLSSASLPSLLHTSWELQHGPPWLKGEGKRTNHRSQSSQPQQGQLCLSSQAFQVQCQQPAMTFGTRCCEKCQDKETSSTLQITFNISGGQAGEQLIHQILPNSPHFFSTHTRKSYTHTHTGFWCVIKAPAQVPTQHFYLRIAVHLPAPQPPPSRGFCRVH